MNNFVSESLAKSPSYIHKILLTLQHLQGIREFHDGVKLNDIVAFIKTISDGDVLNQVKTALSHSVCMGYVQKNNENYQLVVGAAKIHQMPCCSSRRHTEINRIKHIFSTKWVSGKSYQDFLAFQETAGQTTPCDTKCSLNENNLVQNTVATENTGLECSNAVKGDIKVHDEKPKCGDHKQHDNHNNTHHSKIESVKKSTRRVTFSINDSEEDHKNKFKNEKSDKNLNVPICETPLIVIPNNNPTGSLKTTSNPRPLQIKDSEPKCSTDCEKQLLDEHAMCGKQREFDNHDRDLKSKLTDVQRVSKSRSRSPSVVRINRKQLRSVSRSSVSSSKERKKRRKK